MVPGWGRKDVPTRRDGEICLNTSDVGGVGRVRGADGPGQDVYPSTHRRVGILVY